MYICIYIYIYIYCNIACLINVNVLINMYRLRGNYCIYKTLKCVIKGCCCCVKIGRKNDLFYWSVNGTDITLAAAPGPM